MPHPIVLSADAEADIDQAFEYYNRHSYGLGFEFTDTLDRYFKKISRLPTASAIRYDNIRVKPIDTFPFTIHFCIEQDGSILIIRVFNTNQEPFWK
jgi:plasmid stabilization system protein ParE